MEKISLPGTRGRDGGIGTLRQQPAQSKGVFTFEVAPLLRVGLMAYMRKFIALGTASQVPTRHRNHNGYFLKWEEEGILFDPGEGTQRQMILANVSASEITKICITHFHGDHC